VRGTELGIIEARNVHGKPSFGGGERPGSGYRDGAWAASAARWRALSACTFAPMIRPPDGHKNIYG
jgi:hypothetical protein